MIKLIIKEIPPSNNKFLGNSHNFNIYRKAKEEWHWFVRNAIKEKPKKPYEKAIVKIKYYFPDKRRRDPDNYSGKMLLDPLTKEGIIKDDSFNHITLLLEGGYCKENPRTEIEVTEVDNGSNRN